MSFLYESKQCYSNDLYYDDRKDTFAKSQARQANDFVVELCEQRDATRHAAAAVKEKADELLRITKSRAIQWVKENEQKESMELS